MRQGKPSLLNFGSFLLLLGLIAFAAFMYWLETPPR